MKNCPICKTDNPNEARFCRICGSKFADVPEIIGFCIEPVYRIGDTVYVSWNIENADTIQLNGLDVTGKNQTTITITDKTELMLVARKGTIEKSCSININPIKSIANPTIDRREDVCKSKNYGKSHLTHYTLTTIIFAFLLFWFANNTKFVHHNIHVSYNSWKWIEPLLWSILILCGIFSTIMLIISIKKSNK